MYFLERKERYSMSNVLGNHSMPVDTYRWEAVATCEDKEPLEEILKDMDKQTHRITSNMVQ